MTRGFKANEDTRRNIVGKHPVPHGWRACFVVSLSEDILRILEAVGFGDADGQPDDVERKVEQNDVGGDAEDVAVRLRVEVVHANSEEENALRDNPLHSAELDVASVGWESEAKDRDFRKQKVGCGLAVAGNEGSPSGRAPPSDNEAEEASILATS